VLFFCTCNVHTDFNTRVISLEMSPVDDTFLSASLDNTVRLWDVRTPNCRGLLYTPSTPIVAYETSGSVFAVALNGYNRINLYDFNNFDKAPFLTIELVDPSLAEISFPPKAPFMTSMSFSGNAQYILVGTAGDAHYVLDAYDGDMIVKLDGFKGLERGKQPGSTGPSIIPHKGISGEELSWTPDSKFVVGGSHDGKVYVWDLSDPANLQKVPKGGRVPVLSPCASLEGHPGPSRCVRINPKWAMMATAGAELAFWLPDISSPDENFDVAKIKGKLS
jgi:COMPASS component SWD2